jgi:beta-lactamase superfamily II metal-dependent hydrolase
MKRFTIALAGAVVLAAPWLVAQPKTSPKPLEIYVVDTEGGKADLWVTPTGETLLIDAGNPGGRDTDRIQEVMAAAGVTKIDYLLLTHYHVDHVGGVQELVKRLPPIAHFLDHGPTVEDGAEGHQREQVQGFQAAYAEIYGKAQHTILKAGDKIPIPGLDWRIAISAGKGIKTPLPGAGKPNPECAQAQRQPEARDPENAQSVGSVITYGAFRALDFGDLTRDAEFDLMCPNNPIGTVDLFFPANHGSNNSNAPFLVHAIQPRVAVVQNGTGKGASVDMFQALRSTPGFEDVWQLHWANGAGIEHNSPGVFIANGVDPATIAGVLTAPPRGAGAGGGGRPGGGPGGPGGGAPGAGPAGPPAAGAPAAAPQAGGIAPAAQTPPPAAGQAAAGGPGGAAGAPGAPGAGGPGGGRGGFGGGGAAAHTPAYWIKISVQSDGSFTVTNSRNNFSKTYTKHK